MAEDRAPTEGGSPPNALFVGLAGTTFGFGVAAAGFAAAIKKALGGRVVSPRKGGSWLYVTAGVSCEATRKLGGWKSSEVVEWDHSKVRPGDVAPGMRAAVAGASDRVEMGEPPKGPGTERNLVEGCEVGLSGSSNAWRWFARPSRLADYLIPKSASPLPRLVR